MDLTPAETLLTEAGQGWQEHQPEVVDADCPSCDTGYCRPHHVVSCAECGDDWPCYTIRAYQAGREAAARPTCQENPDPGLFRFSVDAHLHECSREAKHRSKVHRCACGVEWWLAEGPVIGYRIELDDVGEVVFDPADVTIVRADISLGRSSQGVGDNPEEQR